MFDIHFDLRIRNADLRFKKITPEPETSTTNPEPRNMKPYQLLWSLHGQKGHVRIHNPQRPTLLHVHNFDELVLKANTPVLVDYWAEWCGPCKMIAPVLDEISQEYTGKITVAKLNIDENPATPSHYGVRGIPTLMLFKDGDIEATKVGALTKSQLSQFIDSNI